MNPGKPVPNKKELNHDIYLEIKTLPKTNQ